MTVRIAALTALTMLAFAANSVLNRVALADGAIGAVPFAAIRVAAGAAMLALLVWLRGGKLRGSRAGALALSLYMLGFSLAYEALDTGTGALILFGGVQVTMLVAAIRAGELLSPRRWLGSSLAVAGLAALFWPIELAGGDTLWALSMAAAALGWGLYSLIGRGAADPLADTAGNFARALPVVLLALAIAWVAVGVTPPRPLGFACALLSGAITSGLGYALWYSVLPRLDRSTAALAQLTVPAIAAAGGALLLGEVPDLRLVLAGSAILGGVALGLVKGRSVRVGRS